MQDPRIHNKLPRANNLNEFFSHYREALSSALAQIPGEILGAVFDLLETAIAKKQRIYVAGNGGSSAIADHLCCDWMKGIHISGQPGLRVQSLTSNSALLTALSNDYGYDQSIATQVEILGESGDVLILISSSGNSSNMIQAAEMAKKKGMNVLAMCGFSGGKLKTIADLCLFIPVENYGIVEDAHQILMHVLSQYLAHIRDQRALSSER